MYKCRTRAYEGTEPYIFISYSHADSDEVFRIIDYLDDKGFRVWYDEGIAPGSEWTEYIAEHLNACQVCLAFISPKSANSPNCKREINFAVSKKKEFLGVFLSETELSLGLEMQISSHQCVMKQNYIDEERFFEKLLSCNELMPCKAEAKEASQSFLEKMKEEDSLYMEEREEELREKKEALKDKLVESDYDSSLRQSLKDDELKQDASGQQGVNSGDTALSGNTVKLQDNAGAKNKAKQRNTAKVKSSGKNKLFGKEVSENATINASVRRPNRVALIVSLVLGLVVATVIISAISTAIRNNSKLFIGGREYKRDISVINIRDVVVSQEDFDNIKKLTNLDMITFENCAISNADFSVLPNKENITFIEIKDCIGIETFDFSAFPKLRTLTVKNSGVNMSNIKFHPASNIRTLDISGNKDITSMSIIPMEGVSKIDISDTSITDLSGVKRSDYLRELVANNLNISDITPVCELEDLESLYLNNCNLGNINGKMKSLNLTELAVAGNNMSDASAFDDITVLEYVDFSNNPISYVAAIDKSMGTLKGVNLSNTEYGADIKETLSKCPNVKELRLSGLKCFDELSFLSNMKALELLEVNDCALTSLDGIERHSELAALSCCNNSITSIKSLNSIGQRVRLDIRNNNISSLSELSAVKFDAFVASGNPIGISVIDIDENLEIGKLVMDYTDDLLDEKLKTVIGGGQISYVCMVDIPDDKKVAAEKVYYSGWLSYATTEQVDAYFEAHPIEVNIYWSVKDIGQ